MNLKPQPVKRIRFMGKRMLLIGTKKSGGAITTPYRFANFYPSVAHLYDDGIVRQYGVQIGTADDIRIIRRKRK